MSDPQAWVAHGGTNILVITSGDTIWVAEGSGMDEGPMLREGLAAMRAGEWEPNVGDGWTVETDGPFDPENYLGWQWTEVTGTQ